LLSMFVRAEMGDKAQLVMAAQYGALLLVVIDMLIGNKLASKIPMKAGACGRCGNFCVAWDRHIVENGCQARLLEWGLSDMLLQQDGNVVKTRVSNVRIH